VIPELPSIFLYFLAALPILILLGLMIGLRWGGQKAGPASWLVCLAAAILAFGLTPAVFWVSQVRGLFLAFTVLAVLWPALLLYNIVDRAGGIRAIAGALGRSIFDRGLLLVVLAWAFSAMLEGLAGFGLPIAVVSPMLVSLGVNPVSAVAAVAVGHAWSVTFGDMGVIFQTLSSVVGIESAELVPAAGLALGAACLACGLATSIILGQRRLWPAVTALALLMSLVQYGLAAFGVTALAGFGAGLVGVLGGMLFSRPPKTAEKQVFDIQLAGAAASYGGLTVLLVAVAWPGPLRSLLYPAAWHLYLPEVGTGTGFITPAGQWLIYRPLLHPGTAILIAALLSYALFRRMRLCTSGGMRTASLATWRSAAPASVGILSAVCLSTMMEHSGMTHLLAQGLAALTGAAFPLVSPLVGILGAFATGSNNNSNVLFAPLQKNIAALLELDPRLLLATQTAGGSLGSMLAPAKLIVGCSTVGLQGREGEVLRRTLAYGLGIGLLLGGLALIFSR
jgi:lactate permease